jgi:TRAP-type C4-dicarboxylate transport system substrate-binding protein
MLRITALMLGALALAPLPAARSAAGETPTAEEVMKLADAMEPFSVHVVGLHYGGSESIFLERPFWNEQVKELSRGKVTVQHNSMSDLNLQGGEVFRLTSQGTFDVADIVANYGAGDVPQLDAMDLAGVATNFDEIRAVLAAYVSVATAAVEERFNLEVLGAAHSTAQMFFCKPEVASAADLRGKKVRLTSSTLADVVSGLGGTPVTMAFPEIVPAMQRGVLDCVITGTMSANTGKLNEVADHVLPLVVGWAHACASPAGVSGRASTPPSVPGCRPPPTIISGSFRIPSRSGTATRDCGASSVTSAARSPASSALRRPT